MIFGKHKARNDSEEIEDEIEEDSEESPKNEGKEQSTQTNTLAEIERLKVKVESFNELRRGFTERFSLLTEQVGELRGMIMDTNRSMQGVEIKATKAADLVAAVHPEKILLETQKTDGKIEALRANIESNEAMMHRVLEELKNIKNLITIFKGIDEVVKLNEDVRQELVAIRQVKSEAEHNVQKVDNYFIEIQKIYTQFTNFPTELKNLKDAFKQLNDEFDDIKVMVSALTPKKEVEQLFSKFEKFIKRVGRVLSSINERSQELESDYNQIKETLLSDFQSKIYKAEMMSNAFENVLKTKPELLEELNLMEFLKEEAKKEAKKEETKAEQKKFEKKSELKTLEEPIKVGPKFAKQLGAIKNKIVDKTPSLIKSVKERLRKKS